MSEPEACPKLPEVRAFWDGELRGEAVEELTRHLDQCRICREEYREIERFMALLAAGDLAEPLGEERREEMRAAVLAECRVERGRVVEGRRTFAGFLNGLFRRPARALSEDAPFAPGAGAPGYLPVAPPGLQGPPRRGGGGRRLAWVLVPVGAVVLLAWLGRLQRPAEPGAMVVRTAPGTAEREETPRRQVQVTPAPSEEPRKPVDAESPPRQPKRNPGPSIAKEREEKGWAGRQERRSETRIVQAAPVQKAPLVAGTTDRQAVAPKPIRRNRVAVHQAPKPAPTVRERLVVLAEGSAFASESEPVRPEPIRIIASGGSGAPAGQASIVLTNEGGDR